MWHVQKKLSPFAVYIVQIAGFTQSKQFSNEKIFAHFFCYTWKQCSPDMVCNTVSLFACAMFKTIFAFIEEQQKQQQRRKKAKNNGAGDNNHHFSCLWLELFRHFSPCRLQSNQSLSVLWCVCGVLAYLSDFRKQNDGVHFSGKSNAPHNLYSPRNEWVCVCAVEHKMKIAFFARITLYISIYVFRFPEAQCWSCMSTYIYTPHTHIHIYKWMLCAISHSSVICSLFNKLELKSWRIMVSIFLFVDFEAFALSLIGKRNRE